MNVKTPKWMSDRLQPIRRSNPSIDEEFKSNTRNSEYRKRSAEVERAWVHFLTQRPTHPINFRLDISLKMGIQDDHSTRVRYITDDDIRKLAARIIHRLNRALFGARARRRHNPERLTALVCQHSRNAVGNSVRPHLHCLLAIPPDVPLDRVSTALDAILPTELFVYREWKLNRIENPYASVIYNMNPVKTSTLTDAIIYQHVHQEEHACNVHE